jgi:hypothetical protein
MTKTPVAAVLVAGVLLGGCYPLRGMRAVPVEQVRLSPPAGQAAIVFMRSTGGSIFTSLFELREPPDRFIGILVSNTRLIHLVAPGRTRFMLVGGSASFLDADLVAGMTYSVGIAQGDLGEGQFALRPLRAGDLERREWKQCSASCVWVENTERSQEWARTQWSSIQRKKARDLPKWESRADRPALMATDGR